MRSSGSSGLSGGQSWTEERQAEVRLRSGGPLGAGLKEDRQRRGLGQKV